MVIKQYGVLTKMKRSNTYMLAIVDERSRAYSLLEYLKGHEVAHEKLSMVMPGIEVKDFDWRRAGDTTFKYRDRVVDRDNPICGKCEDDFCMYEGCRSCKKKRYKTESFEVTIINPNDEAILN